MAKVDIELVKVVLQRNEIDIRTVSQVLEDLNEELKLQVDEEKPPAPKKQFTFLVSDPRNQLPDVEFTGWVLQIPEDDSVYLTEERLVKAAYTYNQTPKGRRMPVKTIAEICEHVPARYLKEEMVWVKSKEPVFVLKTNNKIPTEGGAKSKSARSEDEETEDEA